MHEHSITESLLEQAIVSAETAGGVKIARIHLRVGELSSYTEDSIRFYWDQISPGTIAAGAELVFYCEEGVYRCLNCSQTFPSSDMEAICLQCGSMSLDVVSGKHTYLEALDIDQAGELSPVP